jgi:hypothetical protein
MKKVGAIPQETKLVKAARRACEAGAVVEDAEAYQRSLDIAAHSDVHEAIRQGLDDVANGRTRPAQKVLNEIRRRYAIPR